MARKGTTARQLAALDKKLLALRKKAAALRREERGVEREIDRLVRGASGRLTRVRHSAGSPGGGAHPRPTGPRMPLAAARQRGGGGLFCGCPPIRIFPQPNDDLDICILVACSDGSCEYWCATLEAPPIVGIARTRGRRRGRAS